MWRSHQIKMFIQHDFISQQRGPQTASLDANWNICRLNFEVEVVLKNNVKHIWYIKAFDTSLSWNNIVGTNLHFLHCSMSHFHLGVLLIICLFWSSVNEDVVQKLGRAQHIWSSFDGVKMNVSSILLLPFWSFERFNVFNTSLFNIVRAETSLNGSFF